MADDNGQSSRGGGAALVAGLGTLAVAAIANALAARRAERATPPVGRIIEAGGAKVHVVERGEGPPVVLLHGNGAMAQDWLLSGVVDRLAAAHRVVIVERPGFGHSSRPRRTLWTPRRQAGLLADVLARLGVARATIVGHSLGAIVAKAFALDHPGATAALGLLSGYHYPEPRFDVVAFSASAVPGAGDILRYTINPPIGRLIAPTVYKKIFAPAEVTPAFAAGFPLGLAIRPSQLRASSEDTAFMTPSAAALAPRHGELKMPVLIAHGDGDKLIGLHHATRLHAEIAGSDLMVLPGAGHMIHHIAPTRVADAIAELAARA